MKMRTTELFNFIKERQFIYRRRKNGVPKPWTKNSILQQYRFCNVYREQDTVTAWIAQHWRAPHQREHELWFGMVVARLLNLPASLEAVGWPIPWNEHRFIKVLHKRQAAGHNVFNAAYIVSTNGVSMDKIEYVAQRVLTPLWKDREKIISVVYNHTLGAIPPPTLAQVHHALTQYIGIGSFLSAQVIADLKYAPPLQHAVDWWSWASSGPGSRRGLNRVCGFDPQQSWNEKQWLSKLQWLQLQINDKIEKFDTEATSLTSPLHAQDLQNCLCEFDKYERVRLGQGRPKQKYPGGE